MTDPHSKQLANEFFDAVWRMYHETEGAPLGVVVKAACHVIAFYLVNAVPPDKRAEAMPLLWDALKEAMAIHGAECDGPAPDWAEGLGDEATKH
jgi:hypothetical protein